MLILLVTQTVVVAVLLVLVVSLLRSHAAILRRLHDAGFGVLDDDAEETPGGGIAMSDDDLRTHPDVPGLRSERGPLVDVAGTRPNGAVTAIGIERSQSPTLLAFLSSGCITCGAFWEAFRHGAELPGGARLVIVTQGEDRESPSKVAELAPRSVMTVMSSQAWDDYGVPGSPYFVLAGPGGQLLGEGSAMGWPQVEELIVRALGDRGMSDGGKGRGREPGRRRWRDRERDTDEELLAAGIGPGDPRLFHDHPSDPDVPGRDDGPA